MAFAVRPLKFSHTDRVLAVERAVRITHHQRVAAIAEMIREVENGRGFMLGGVRGCGKTALLYEVSFHFNSEVGNVLALGPLSLRFVAQQGLDSVGSQLADWLRQNQTQLPFNLHSSNQPANADSFNAWLPLLKRLIVQRNASTLLLLLNDLDRVPLEDRATILQDIQDASWALASRVVLGCAEHLTADEMSPASETATLKTRESYYRSGDGGWDELVSVRLKKYCSVELLNAMIIPLGTAPAGKKGGRGKRADSYGKSSVPVKPPGKPSSTTQPSTRAAEPPRYVNLWFAKDRAGESQIAKAFALALDKKVYLRMSIGRFEVHNIMKEEEAVEFPSDKVIVERFPETAGKPLPLEATIFSNDFHVPEAERTQKFSLVRGQPTAPICFPVTPRKKKSARLRVCVFYKNHLLQSLGVTAGVKKRSGIARNPQSVEVEMSLSANFNGADRLPGRGLWLGINQNADDTHTLNFKNSKTALSRNMGELKIKKALEQARKALREVSFDIVTDDSGQEEKVYRFETDNSIAGNEADQRERFRKDLTRLAVAGNLLRGAIFNITPLAEEKEKVQKIVDEMEKTLQHEQIIQVSRLKHMEDIWPWALIYDSHIDPKKVKRVCLAYRGPDGALPYAEGVKKCDHRDPDTLRNKDYTVVCPYGFWGFKHIIEQPTQPSRERERAFANLVLEIKLGSEPVFEMMLESGLAESDQGQDHVNSMEGLNFKALDSFEEISAAFDPASKPAPPEPHVMYFYCHGRSDDEQGPYLAVGENESLLPSLLNEWNFRWSNSHGLVFINGCHTADLDPSELSTIMQPFIAADASGIIGTEISVTTDLASEFAQEFFKRFLAKDTEAGKVGQIIKDLRLNLLMKYNPLGLVYTPYCSADLHVTH